MNRTAEAVAWSIPIALVVGTTLGATLVMLSGDAPADPDILGAFVIGVMASGYLSLPLGLIGGLFAAAMLKRAPARRALARWVALGAAAGAALGGLGAAAFHLLIGAPWVVVGIFLFMGSLGGAICGATMGLWCARQQEFGMRGRSASERASAA